jgi:hypothetical protein
VAVKLLMSWDILPGKEQDYMEFVVRDLIPGLQRMGMEPSDVWLTVYGDQPQITTAAQMSTLTSLQRALSSGDWQGLTQQLLNYVENFSYKVVPARGGFQM